MRTTAIAGIGATEFSKNSGRSELQLAAEATAAALAEAGLAPSEVDGLVTSGEIRHALVIVALHLLALAGPRPSVVEQA